MKKCKCEECSCKSKESVNSEMFKIIDDEYRWYGQQDEYSSYDIYWGDSIYEKCPAD